MRANIFRLLPPLLFFASCAPNPSSLPDPETLPYKLERVLELGGEVYPIDLDGDGRDEIVTAHDAGESLGGYVVLRSPEGKTIEQVNFAGKVKTLHFVNYDNDATKEILVPFVSNDSLFVCFIDWQGHEQHKLFLISGFPRQDNSAKFLWDATVRGFHFTDVDGDGRQDLISVLSTGFSRQPRGVLINSLPDGRELGRMTVGCALGKSFMGDFNDDGQLEIVTETRAPNNGSVAGGFDDLHSYLLVFAVNTPPKVRWFKQVGGLWTTVELFYYDFDGDGRSEFLVWTNTYNASRAEMAKLELIKTGTWSAEQSRPFNDPPQNIAVADLDRDARPEILGLWPKGDLRVLNHKFEEVRRRQFDLDPSELTVFPNADDDNVEEIAIRTRLGDFLLDPDLNEKAFCEGIVTGVIHQVAAAPPYLLVRREDKVLVMRLVKNRFVLLKRHGVALLWLLGTGVAIAAAMLMLALRREQKLLKGFQTLVLDTDSRGLLLLNSDHRAEMINSALRHWLGLSGNLRSQRAQFSAVIKNMPALADFSKEATMLPAHRREAMLVFELQEQRRLVRVISDPLPSGHSRPSHWLLSFEEQRQNAELQRAEAWAAMAKRVVHDLKNPLSAIQLNLQRLQMEYRDRAPEQTGSFDVYISRITERIESLLRTARNFLKFVNVEKLHLSDTDLNEVVRASCINISRGLPPDVTLEFKPGEKLPFVRVDHDQIHSVLENLVSNAVNAMPEGGKIQISTHPARALQFSHDTAGPRDYVELQVLDTGVGMAEEKLKNIFTPDFIGAEKGTGLGLAIVKKIIDDHHGQIEVNSELGAGTVFYIYLPV